MVDPVGVKSTPPTARLTPASEASGVVATPRSAPVAPVAQSASPSAGQLAAVVQNFAAAPPVDTERVARIRAAIANQTYPILPETIADRLIALKFNWRPHESS